MGVRFPSVSTTTFTTALPANANETIIATLPPLNITLDTAQIFISWFVCITAGTGTTSIFYKIRRGTTLTGTFIGVSNWTHTLAAGNTAVMSGCYVDTPGAIAGQQYVLTATQQGATAGGTEQDIAMWAFAL